MVDQLLDFQTGRKAEGSGMEFGGAAQRKGPEGTLGEELTVWGVRKALGSVISSGA